MTAKFCATCGGEGEIHDPDNLDYDCDPTGHYTYCGGWMVCPDCPPVDPDLLTKLSGEILQGKQEKD